MSFRAFSCLPSEIRFYYHVVDGDEGIVDDLDVEAGLDGRPEDEPPDPLEAVDPDLGRQHLACRRRTRVFLPLLDDGGAEPVLRHLLRGRLWPLNGVLPMVCNEIPLWLLQSHFLIYCIKDCQAALKSKKPRLCCNSANAMLWKIASLQYDGC